MSKLQANLILFAAAAIWGFGDIAHKTVLDHLDPLATVGITALIGGICTLPFARFRLGGSRRQSTLSLARVTLLFLVAQYLQQLAYATATVTNASFLISASSVLTPAAAWYLLGEKPGIKVYVASTLTFCGSLLLSGGLPGTVAPGDLLALLAAASFAVWTVEVSRHALIFKCDFTTASAQFLGVALIILPISWASGQISWDAIVPAWPELVILGVFSIGLGFYLQICAQRYTSASHAAIIVSAECVFAAVAAALWLSERLTLDGFVGAVLIFAGVILVATAGSSKPVLAVVLPAPASVLMPVPVIDNGAGDELR